MTFLLFSEFSVINSFNQDRHLREISGNPSVTREMLELLHSFGAVPNERHLKIFLEGKSTNVEALEFFLSKMQDFKCTHERKENFLQLLCKREKLDFQFCDVFLKKAPRSLLGSRGKSTMSEKMPMTHLLRNSNLSGPILQLFVDNDFDIALVQGKSASVDYFEQENSAYVVYLEKREEVDVEVIRILLKHCGPGGNFPLLMLCKKREPNFEAIEEMVKAAPSDINFVMWKLLEETCINLKLFKFLLERGQNLELMTRRGDILHVGLEKGFYDLEVVKMLIEKGVDLNRSDHRGKTAILWWEKFLTTILFL